MEKKRKLLVLLLSFMMVFTTMPASIGVAFADDISSDASAEESVNLIEEAQDYTDSEEYVSEPADNGEDTSAEVIDEQEPEDQPSDPVISEETISDVVEDTDTTVSEDSSYEEESSEYSDEGSDIDPSAEEGSEMEEPSYEEESSDPADDYSDTESSIEDSSDEEEPADTEEDEEETEEEPEEDAYAQYISRNGLIAVNVQGKAAEDMQVAAETLEEQGDVSPETAKFLAGELFRDFNGPYTPETIPNYDRQGDGTNIEGISAQWVSTDTTEDGDPLNLYVKPVGDNRQSVMLQVDYHLSGQYDYAPGTIKITVPAYIFTKRGTGEGQPPNYGTMIIPYPEDNNNTDDFKWNLKGDHYELINVNTLSAATKGFIRFSIAGMLPHDLIDMQTSAPFSADIYVETFANSKVLGLRSNSLTAVFDTDVNLTAVEKKQAGNVQIVPKSVIPADQRVLKEDGTEEEYYVLVNWYMTASTTSNTYYSLTYTDELVKNRNNTTYNGFIVKSYNNAVSDGANGKDTVSTNAGTSAAFHGYREMNGNTSMVQTAYPYSQFKAGTYYYFKNKVTYNLVEDDTGKTVSKSSDIEIRWYYEDPKWPTPGGHFMVNKNGNDGSEKGNSVHRLTYDTYVNNDHHLWNRLNNGYYGVYATALNNLRDGEDVVLSYTLDSIGFVMPWFYDSNAAPAEDGTPATRSSSNYTRPVEITTEDTGMSIGRNMTDPEWDGPTEDMAECIPLTAGTDYNFISLEFPGSPYVYKATPNNLGPNGSVNATSYGDGTFKYVKDTTASNWPDVDIYIQTGGSAEWTKYAVFSWEDESFALTDGGTVSGVKISLPENTTNFKTVVTLQNDPLNPANDENYAIQAGINYDVRVETKLYHDSSIIANKVAESFEESNAPQLYIFNNDKMTANRADGNKDLLVVIPRDGYNMVRGYELDTMVVPSKNGDFDESVDFYNNVATIHYSAQVEEKTLIGDLDSYNQALADGLVPKERNVIWRDLLPPGMTPDLNSIDLVRENDRLTNAYYINIKELKPEYTGPDRNILIVYATLNNEPEIYSEGDATYYQDVPQIKFDASIDLKSIQGYGYDRSRIHNVISFESLDIDNLGTVTNYQGEPDDPHANRNAATEAAFENETEKYLMTNLDPERDTNSFLYAGTYTRLLIPTAAISSLDKVVNVNNEKRWSTGLYSGNKEENQRLVYLNGTYKYRLSYSPESSDTVAKNIIFYDSLENFYAGPSNDGGIDEGAPRWQGKFAGVDTSMLETSGCDPVVWYSLEENLQIASEADEHQAHEVNTVLQGPVWIKASEYTGDLSLVKAIAVDASKSVEKDENGNALDFELEYGQSATFIINMKAPTEEEADENEYIYKKNGERVQGAFGDSAQAYNNAYVRCNNYNKADHTAMDDTFVRKDYTKVGLFNYEVSITKAWNDDDDRDGKRPDSVVIQLCTEDGPVEGKEIELPLKDENGEFITDEEGHYIWSYTFKYLPNVTPDGKTINYTFMEKNEDANYSSSISIDGTHYTLTNKHNPERTKLEGTKTWVGDTEDVRPVRIWVDLYQDGIKVDSTYTDASKNWNWSFTNLYKYRDGGTPIVYTYKENFEYVHMDSYISETVGNEIINTYHPYGDLKVHKATKDTTEASKDKEFEFVFDFEHDIVDEEGHTATATLPGPFNYEILDEEGNFVSGGTILSGGTIKIKGGQTIHIIEIDEGARYTVTEISTDGFYNSDKEGFEGTIKPNEVVEASFENTYSSRGKAYLKAIKHYENHKIDDFQFSYGVYEVKENGEEVLIRTSTAGASGSTPYEILDDGTVVYSADVSFGAFSYSLADDGKTFTYRIKEDIPSDADADLLSEGTTYDNTVYTVTVAVSDKGDGTMNCDVTYYDKNGNVIAEPDGLPVFTNKYQAEGNIELKAWKELVGRDPVNKEFTFALLDENGQPVLDENGQAITTTNVGKEIIFPAIHYTERDAGKTYKYIAVEVPGTDPNVHYDTKQIGFIVTVVDKNNGKLEPTFVYADPETWSTENVGVGKFVNTLEPGSLEVTKKISEDSTDYDVNQTFTFKIKFIGDVTGITFPEGFTGWDADNKTATVSLRGNESFTIDNIPAGTTYNVTEEYLDGWIPIAQDNVSGNIITSETAKASITNQYQPDIATVQLFGTKMLDNKAAEKELFTFTLDEKANADGKIKIINASGKVVETDLPLTVKNTDGGFIQFPIIIYEEPGEHIYTIKEQIGEDDTIDYDAHEETVKVTVTKDETSGMLLANIEYTTGDVEFLNKKHPGNLRITKEGDTHSYTDDEFYFLVTLVNEDGQPLSENGTIDWYTEKTGQSKAAIFFEKAGEKISSGWDSVKTWAKGTWEDIKEVFTEPLVDTAYGADGDVVLPVSGEYAGIDWQITADGELILGNGAEQTMTLGHGTDWPWNADEYKKNGVIKSVRINGTIKANGSLNHMFDGSWTTQNAQGNTITVGGHTALTSIDLSGLDTSRVTSMNDMFYRCSALTTLNLGENFSTSNVSSMVNMFGNCESLTSLDVSHFDTSKVTNMQGMFAGCKKLTSLDVSHFNTSKVVDMSRMFSYCEELTSLDVSHFDTSEVTNMGDMFYYCRSLTSLDVSHFDTSKVTYMQGMFYNCKTLTSLDVSNFDTSNVTNMRTMFMYCENITSLDVSNFNTEKVTTMEQMFQNCYKLASPDLSNFNTTNVVNMRSMFSNCESFQSLDVSNFDTSNVKDMSYMFYNCSGLTSLDVTHFNTSKVENMCFMFMQCSGLTSLNVTNFNTSNVKDMKYMFKDCSGLTSLDVTHFNTEKVTDMQRMFANCSSLSSLNVTNFNTSKVTSMNSMFADCSGLTALDLSHFDTSYVTNMSSMFANCTSLGSLDVTNFDTSNVTDMSYMFKNCSELTELDLSSFDTSVVTNMSEMFKGVRLESLDLSMFNTSNVNNMSSMFWDAEIDDLDISGFNTDAIGYKPMSGNTGVNNGMYGMFGGSNIVIKKIHLGPYFEFVKYPGDDSHTAYTPTLNLPSRKSPYTGKWIRQDGLYGPYTREELSAVYNDDNPSKSALAGVWIWEEKDGSCKVRFDANGGYTTAQTQTLKKETDTVTMPNEGTTMRPGFDLIGWNTEPDGSGTQYRIGQVVEGLFEADTTKTLYAQWESTDKLHYVVEHYQQDTDLRGYTLAEREVKKIPLEDQGTTVTPDVKDYLGFIAPDTQTGTVEGDYTLTIQYYYDRTTYTIKFDANGGEGQMDDLAMLGNVSRRLPENGFTKQDSIFKGWNTEPDGTGTYYANAQRVNNLAENGETVTLYAQWVTNQSTDLDPTTGQIIVHCKEGETIVIPNLPAGTTYTIQEINNPNGWTQTGIVGENGELIPGSNEQSTGHIDAGGDDQTTVYNAYKAKGQIVLRAMKILEGGTLEAGDYTFVLTDSEGNELGRKTCAENGTVVFDAITYEYAPGADPAVNDLGTHTYYISEVAGNDEFTNYDSHTETVTVTVTDPHINDPAQGGALDVTAVYSGEKEMAVFTNTKEFVDVSGTKVWEDDDNQDGIRPDQIVIHLLADGKEKDSKTVTANNGWSWTFSNLPKYDYEKEGENKEIVYTITEDEVTGYSTVVNDYNVTNTHVPETTEVSGSKTWDDKNNQDAARPSSITINLFADGVQVDSKEVTAADEWKWSFTDLPKYNEGVEIKYTITEDPVEDYTTVVNGYDVKNTHVPETTSVWGLKRWVDGDNMDGIRPSSIVVYLYADGQQIDTKTVTAAENWRWDFSNLPKYNNGTLIEYTVQEKAITGYTSEPVVTETGGHDIINTHYTAKGSVTFAGKKTLDNKTLEAGAFTFLIMEGDTEIARVTNKADGTIEYPVINYTHNDIGTHTYTVTEIEGDIAGVVYSETTHTVTVEVTDVDHDGVLEVTPSDNATELNFNNVYEAKGSLELSGKKILENKTLEAGKYQFGLYNLAGGNLIDTATNDADGNFKFEQILFEQDDVGDDGTAEYIYTVKEIVPDEPNPGVTYDENTIYYVKVTIRDDGEGHILVDHKIYTDADCTQLAENGIEFTNTYAAEGSVTFEGTKTIDGRAMTASDIFSFSVKENGTDKSWNVENSAPDGKINYPTISYTLDDVGEHTYTVTETTVGSNGITKDSKEYTVTVNVTDNGDGTLSIVKSDNWNALNFTNKYNATGSVTFEGVKRILNREMTEDDTFTFEVTQVDPADPDKTWTVSNSAPDGKINYPEIEYTLADAGKTYTYKVKETTASTESLTSDSKEYTVTVTITDDGQGHLIVTKTAESDDYTALNFTNVYNAGGSITFAGTKTIDSRKIKEGETFSFRIVEKIEGEEDKLIGNVQSDSTGKIEYPTIEYTLSDVGTHTYVITETSTNGNGITVDTKSYTVIIEVKDDGQGHLTATKTEASADPIHLDFVNKYEAKGAITLAGTKKLAGRDITSDDEFTFEIREGNTVVATGTSKGGTITFTEIGYLLDATHNDVGDHTYTIVETSTDGDGITVDKNSVTVVVTVTDNGDGTLSATTAEGTKIEFNNTYAAAGSVTFEGTKTIDGRAMTASDIFSFSVKENGTDKSWNVQNDATGKINYPTISYTLDDVGTHTYTVTETSTGGNGITVATNNYTVTVTVTDNGNGTLKVETSTNANALDFVNTYEATGELKLDGTKTLTGRALTAADTFTFEVKEGNTVVSSGTAHGTAAGGNTAAISYADIEYTLEDVGTHTYTVTETSVDGNGITVATNRYTFTVTVADNGNGTLSVTENNDGRIHEALDFTNTYDANASVTFAGTKTIDGRDMTAADIFSFSVTENGTDKSWNVQNDATGKINYPTISYTLDDVGEHTYTVTETSENGKGITVATNNYTVTVTVTDNGNGTLKVETSTNANALNFENTYAATGKLELDGTKTLEGRALKATDTFTFEVKEGTTVVSSGTAQGTAAGGNTAAISYADIEYTLEDVGTHTYTVTETSVSENGITVATNTYTFTVTVADNGDGSLSVTENDNGRVHEKLDFTNVYDAEGEITFEGTKRLDGRAPTDSDVFTFEIKEGNTVIGEGRSDKSGKITYPTIEYGLDDLGEHTYTITESTENGNGITVDTRTYTVVVNVTDDGNGHLTATPTSGNIHTLNFTNTYTATGSITFEGTKRISGRDMTAKDKFEFTLYDEDGKAIETVENGADGKIVFSTINYTLRDVGTHTYTVKETSEGADGIIVDNKTYTIVVTVADGGNGELIITTDNGLEKSLAFVNVYEAEGEITFEGTKSIDGRDLLETDEFSFTLYDQNGKALETVHQDENGDFAFTTLEYDEKDVGKTYTYTVKETSTDGKGITVDKTEYTITVTVSDKGDGTLQITTNTDEVDPHHLDFQNRYAATGEYKPEGTKTLTGRTLTANDKFTFEVKEGDKVVSTGTNDATGKIDFTKIEYTLDDVGTHTYLVTETSANGNGITVDTNYYTVTVTVTDKGDGTLNVVTSTNAKALDFENKYEAEGSTTFEGTKTIDGRAMTEADVFSFQIVENGTDKIWSNVTNSAPDGKINYPTINYTLADVGEHTYTVTETSVDGNGITKDSREYTVTVTVTDNGDGKLNVETSNNAKALNFENKYAATGEYKPEGLKTLTGRTLTENDKFTFEVKEGDKVVSTGTNDATGKIDFSTIRYTLADVGEHTYTVTEVKGELGGVDYSTESYTVTVTVSDNGNGTLNVVTSENAKALNFTNEYSATGEYKPEGTKTLTGRTLTANDKFTFEVKEGEKVVSTGTNDETGKIDFTKIKYTLDNVGTHTYTVTEIKGELGGVDYSTASYTVTVTVTDNGDGTLNVAASDNAKALNFTNIYSATGEYKPEGTKTLTGRALTENDEFTFEVKEGEKVVSTGTSDETGKIDFTKINYTLADVGEHTYTVTEVKGELGGVDYSTASYTVTVTITDNGDGTLNVVASDNAKALNFTNEYSATGEYKPEGTKTLTGRALTENDEFTFEVKEGEKVVSTGTSDETGKIDFSTIDYTLADVGEHTYTVTEVKGELGGVDYSTASYTVTVNVTDNGDGTLNVATSANGKALNFTNIYSAEGSVLFEGTKHITGRTMNEEDIFTFEVREGEELIQTVTNGADGKINFESIAYTLEDVGTHEYTVKETSEDGDGITADTKVYTVTATVTDNGDGTLNVATSENAKELTFVNTYAADGEITFSGIKSIDGRELKPEDKFEFTLFDSEGEEIEKVTNGEDGYYSFTALEYDLDDLGTHEYTVKETSEDGKGITVDTTEYKITVNVEDGGKGDLVITAETDKEGTDVSHLNFTNKYEATGSVQLEASKTLLGRILREAEFEFELYKDGQFISRANNANDGKIIFDKIDYDLSDAGKSYEYTVREVAGDVPGVTYDEREFKITVTITDNGDGTLNAEVTVDKEVVFVNPYNAEGKLVLEGKKTLEGGKLAGNDFEFTVSKDGKEIQTVKNDAKGKIAFEEICFTLEDVGTHTFTVKEKAGDQRGMYYDQTEYMIKVKVSDNGDGTLEVKILDKSDDPRGLNFKNTYEPPTNPPNPPKKPQVPKTGDSTDVMGYAFLLTASMLALTILFRRKKTDK